MSDYQSEHRYQKTFRFDLNMVRDLERMSNNTRRQQDDLIRESIDLLAEMHPEYLSPTASTATAIDKLLREIEDKDRVRAKLAKVYPYMTDDLDHFEMTCQSSGLTLAEVVEEHESTLKKNVRSDKAALVGFLKGLLFLAGDNGLDSNFIKRACTENGYSVMQVQRYLKDVGNPIRSGNSVTWVIKK